MNARKSKRTLVFALVGALAMAVLASVAISQKWFLSSDARYDYNRAKDLVALETEVAKSGGYGNDIDRFSYVKLKFPLHDYEIARLNDPYESRHSLCTNFKTDTAATFGSTKPSGNNMDTFKVHHKGKSCFTKSQHLKYGTTPIEPDL